MCFVAPVSTIIYRVTCHVMLNAIAIVTTELSHMTDSIYFQLWNILIKYIYSKELLQHLQIFFSKIILFCVPTHPCSSSLLSPQSFSPLHLVSEERHCWFAQRNPGHPIISGKRTIYCYQWSYRDDVPSYFSRCY